MNTAAWLVACYRLLTGGSVGRAALRDVLERNWVYLPLVVWQLKYYLTNGVGPLLWRSVRCAVQGRPALLLAVTGVVGGVRMLLKHRSTFYIALEVSGMFVFIGYLLVASVVSGLGLLGHPPPESAALAPAGVRETNASDARDLGDAETTITGKRGMSKITSTSEPKNWSSEKRVYRKRVVIMGKA
ncbi:uncharacterized protein B0H64DRAFT_389153 [Chaetomium fimeti]|uniref:Uncharacterized protein n=1 Tax=Chaetomium fimeti TaxID=1854472 RepID=A0AAE0HN66_9PEZI|nr:hypothetical protein B0H64DRAFT_389153 [Chaetomium fimeti]